MELFFEAVTWLKQTLLITKLQDLLEIFIVSLSVYQFCSWLYSDYTKPLLAYFYSYAYAVCFAYFFHLLPLYHILLFTAPIFFILLIIQHQKNLQKHFILQHNNHITAATLANQDWIDHLLRSILLATHHHKSVTCIIEQQDNLEPLLEKPFALGVQAQKELLDILLASDSYDSTKIIWMNAQGTMISTNATWSELIAAELAFHEKNQKSLLKIAAQMLTQRTDALLFHINPQAEEHFIAYQGTILCNMSVNEISTLLHKMMTHKNKTPFTFTQGKSDGSYKNSSF